MKTNKRGVSLIVLVITIIIMIIIAGAIILALNGSGILGQANKARTSTDEKTILEQVNMAMIDSTTTEGINFDTLNNQLEKVGYNGDEIESLPAEIEINGTHILIRKDEKVKLLKWYIDSEGYITNGKTKLSLGDKVNYDATIDPATGAKFTTMPSYIANMDKTGYSSNQTITLSSNPEWMVIGVEEGEILIVSTTNPKSFSLGKAGDVEKFMIAVQYGKEVINNVCAIWGKGKYASGARSIQVEDIDKLTGYDKTSYNANALGQYGNKVTYSWRAQAGWVGSSGENGKTSSGGYTSYGNGFIWFNDETNTWTTSIQDLTNPQKIGTMKCKYYTYNIANDYADLYNTPLGQALFNSTLYLTSSLFVKCEGARVLWGYCFVNNGKVDIFEMVGSAHSKSYSSGFNIRPVVSLKADIKLTGNSTDGWTLSE